VIRIDAGWMAVLLPRAEIRARDALLAQREQETSFKQPLVDKPYDQTA